MAVDTVQGTKSSQQAKKSIALRTCRQVALLALLPDLHIVSIEIDLLFSHSQGRYMYARSLPPFVFSSTLYWRRTWN